MSLIRNKGIIQCKRTRSNAHARQTERDGMHKCRRGLDMQNRQVILQRRLNASYALSLQANAVLPNGAKSIQTMPTVTPRSKQRCSIIYRCHPSRCGGLLTPLVQSMGPLGAVGGCRCSDLPYGPMLPLMRLSRKCASRSLRSRSRSSCSRI